MPKIRHHRSSRRVPPPQDSDFDHEIKLVNHDDDNDEAALRPSSAGPSSSQYNDSAPRGADPVTAGGDGGPGEAAAQPSVYVEEPTPGLEIDRPRSKTTPTPQGQNRPKSPESEIDILFENERGGFLCGIPLFSSKALGNLDPPAWTNYAHKPSPTDTQTAQVPDPSWEWAWPEWRINHDEGVDEDGWEYSFAFARQFSWHKARWWNSFVRRRAWIRKRVKKDEGHLPQDPHMLNPEYFTVRPSCEIDRDRSPSRASSLSRGRRSSMSTANKDGVEQAAIEHADHLLRVLRASRIDREKIEAVDNYLVNAQEDFEGLQHIMHEIMSLFVFQASRRALLTRLTGFYDKAVAEQESAKEATAELDRKVKNLAAAVEHADEEVRRLEYWSDVKSMAEKGESTGAVDQSQGWKDPAWRGVDKSGPSAPPAPAAAKASSAKDKEADTTT